MEPNKMYHVNFQATQDGTEIRYSNRTDKLKLYAEFIRHQIAAFSILFEIITGTKPPKIKELLKD